jgi:hypothetical protein
MYKSVKLFLFAYNCLQSVSLAGIVLENQVKVNIIPNEVRGLQKILDPENILPENVANRTFIDRNLQNEPTKVKYYNYDTLGKE